MRHHHSYNLLVPVLCCAFHLSVNSVWGMMAGGEISLPVDTPSGRIDSAISSSSYNFGGFGNPTVHNDLALLYFEDPLPSLAFPALGLSMGLEDTLTLAGFVRSGYGSYGYTTGASLTDRRLGQNVVDSFEQESGGAGLLFRYDFDAPDTFGTVGGSLGNDVETLIAPGDSGGAALLDYADGLALVGVNTFTKGYGGLFGDIGGGVALDPYWAWISETTGLSLVPESSQCGMFAGVLGLLLTVGLRRRH
ncbi:MAG: hypothetical protein ACSHYA_09510 [Opitutaceae bacterium]